MKISGNSGHASGFCGTTPSGGGDALMVAILVQQWQTMCATKDGAEGIGNDLNELGETLGGKLDAIGVGIEGLTQNLAPGTFVAPGGAEYDPLPFEEERASAKLAFTEALASVRADAVTVFGSVALAAGAELPCTSFTVIGQTYNICFSDYESYLIQIGDALLFLANVFGFFWLTKKD